MQFQYSHGLISIVGAIPATTRHRHHALQLTVPRTGILLVDDLQYSSVLIDADSPHQLSADDAFTLLIDPESHCAALLRQKFLAATSQCTDLPLSSTAGETTHGLLAELLPEVCLDRHLDSRIQQILAWLDLMHAESRWLEVSLTAALNVVHLSESRFLHLFKAETGIAWRPALVWRRSLMAIQLAREGASLTEAAQMAGYADSAHFSRQFRANFGLSPSEVIHNSQFVQAENTGS